MVIEQSGIAGLARAISKFGRQEIRQLASKNYYSARTFFYLQLYAATHRYAEALLIYQMGKVGSTTIFKSLKASGLTMPIYHVHDLTKTTLDRDEKLYKQKFSRSGYWPRHLWESQYLLKQIEEGERKKWKIVTVVRDPVARNISSFFQTLQLEFGIDYNRIKSMTDDDAVKELINVFLEKADHHEYPLTWFDNELKKVFGIDVYDSTFPVSKGYKIYIRDHVNLLVLKLENLNQCAFDAFKEFLDIEEFSLINGNTSSKKAYSTLYRKFLNSFVLPDDYLTDIYTSKYVRHFYSEKEINGFRSKWQHNIEGNS